MNVHIITVYTPETECQETNFSFGKFIAPMRKLSNGSFIDLNNQELVNMDQMIWYPGEPNGGELQECTLYNSKSRQYLWVTFNLDFRTKHMHVSQIFLDFCNVLF